MSQEPKKTRWKLFLFLIAYSIALTPFAAHEIDDRLRAHYTNQVDAVVAQAKAEQKHDDDSALNRLAESLPKHLQTALPVNGGQ